MLSVFRNVKCYPTRMTDIPQCQMVSVFRKKVKYYPRLMSDMTLHNAKCYPYSAMSNVIPDPWQAWSSTMPNVIRIPQCQMLSRTHDRHGIPQCQTLSHTHGSRLGKAMEDTEIVLRIAKRYHTLFMGDLAFRNAKCYHTLMADMVLHNVKCCPTCMV